KITGTPNVPAGDYDFTAAARDEFYDQTISPYSAETTRTFTLTVVNENFTVNLPIANDTIYVYPTGATLPLYYGPVQFNAQANVTTPTPVTYSLFNNPAWLTINPATGAIQGTPTDNINDPGDKNVIVRATTNNGCQVMASKNFTVHVLANSWCGDGVANGGEECDDGNQIDTDGCDNNCSGVCHPDCASRTCGDDGCGGSCGTCSDVKDICYQNNCWTLLAHGDIGPYNKDSLFWKGTLGSNVDFNFNSQTYNSGDLESTIRNKPFKYLKVFSTGGNEQLSLTFSRDDTTFAQKLVATESVSGGQWYPFYNGTWTYVEALLGSFTYSYAGDKALAGLATYGYTWHSYNGECPQAANYVTMSVGHEDHRVCTIYYDWYALIQVIRPEWIYIIGDPDSNIKCRCNGLDYGGWVSCYDISACNDGVAITSYCRNTYGTAICD
ncbi:MAG: putative Ig domain-containing protein, partial [Patescibacteria group bacterium]